MAKEERGVGGKRGEEGGLQKGRGGWVATDLHADRHQQ